MSSLQGRHILGGRNLTSCSYCCSHCLWFYDRGRLGRVEIVALRVSARAKEGNGGLLWSEPDGDSCFSIYQISWIKINREVFVNKRHHLVRVCLHFNWQCFGDHSIQFCCKFSKKIFFYRPVINDKPNFVSFLVFGGAAASSTAKISPFKTVMKREALFNSCPKTVNIQGYSELREPIRMHENIIAIHWFGKY